ncbi:MAG: SUMF1/EgtB/PvdO family nonheme iron enzyme, partial [Candidatus Competibacter sp.]|nr:SUMF1/EgtB/PvdO family nonheme iron enzyme [Candidatus Competibacter sp.]
QPDKKLPWQQAVNLLLPVLDGLREVHRNGFMHRDVKPRNLYLTQRGQLVLLDFGAARQVVSDRTRSLAIYSSGYAAYEQHVQGEQGPWTDVYGAAATLYFALTGHVPPPAPDRMKKDPRKPARHFSPGLPPALDNVLNRALMVEPKKRLQTIEEFEQQLRAVLKQEDKPRSEPSREVKPGSFRLWAMLGSLLLAILVAGLIGKVFPSSKPPDDPTRAPPPAAVVHIVEPPPPVVTTPPPPPKREEPAIPPVVAPVPQTQPVEPIIPSVAEPKPPPVSEAPPVAEPAPAPNPNPERTYLTVKTEPLGAQVRIMNIGPAYQDGIELIPGGFDIEISAPGYQTYRGWHDLVVGVQELKIALQAETKPPPPAGFEVFHDKLLDGGDGPAMVVIPAGEFWMGSPESEAGRGSDEKQHKVMVQRFAIGQYEVTFDEYDRFCDATKRKKPSDKDWGRGRRPVINVSWADATAYANWLSAQTDQSYQLPTEAEWEYAARAGTKTAYWWGTSVRGKRANCNGCGSQWDNQKTALVGSFAANPWGLYDTVGNVWEWTCSLYDENYGGAEGKCIYTASVPSIFD